MLKEVKQRWRSFFFYLITTSYLLMISPSERFFMEKPFPMTAHVLQSKLLTQKKALSMNTVHNRASKNDVYFYLFNK